MPWNAFGRPEGPYTLRLEATDVLNRVSRDQVLITLEDIKPEVASPRRRRGDDHCSSCPSHVAPSEALTAAAE